MMTDARAVAGVLPVGVLTFLLTDLESSTQLWDERPMDMSSALVVQEKIIQEVVATRDGRFLKSRGEGDATLTVFERATDALTAAVDLQRRLSSTAWPGELVLRTRIALHTGEAELREGDYFGTTVNRGARIRSIAKGGEIVLSRATYAVVADSLPAGIELVELGEHHMRGLRRPEFLYFVTGPGLAPPIAPPRMSTAAARGTYVGRRDLLGAVEAALQHPGIVTLVGPGGIGKTRLCNEACDRVRSDFALVAFVDLSGARDVVAVEAALADALSPDHVAMGQPAQEEIPESIAQRARTSLANRRALLAIDNCEQVVAAVASLVADIVEHCPNLTVIATSREPLFVPGERVVAIEPLAVPMRGLASGPDELARVESVRLLLDRTRDAGSELRCTVENADALAQICRRLDGIPLAIELAAARLRSTSPADLLERMSRRPDVLQARAGDERHRTLSNAIDWSYQLLDAEEQALLRRLGVFMGGFTLDAAEAVCADDTEGDDGLPSPDDVYLTLAELVSKSLVVFHTERGRYRLLEPIRVFARTKLEASGEFDRIATRHARWALRAASMLLLDQVSGRGTVSNDFPSDLDNIHAALDWLRSRGDHGLYLRIVAACGYTWFQTEWRRGRAAADVAVGMLETTSSRLAAAVLLTRGIVEQRASAAESIPWLERARSLGVERGDEAQRAWAAFFLGRAVVLQDYERGVAILEEAIECFERLGQAIGIVWAEINIATAANDTGDFDTAHAHIERALVATDNADLASVRGVVVAELGINAMARNDLDRGRALLREGVELHRERGDRWNLASLLSHAAWAEMLAGDLDAARALVRESMQISLDIDAAWQLCEAMLVLAAVCRADDDATQARALVAATGWDIDPPWQTNTRDGALVARATDAVRPLLTDRFDAAAREGRRLGLIGMAKTVLAA